MSDEVRSTAWSEGYQAFSDYDSIENPYDFTDNREACSDWDRGWLAAYREYYKDDANGRGWDTYDE